ncbi:MULTISPECIES: hypothetical protein [unclassified Bradyrhizobium]|uniref:hypothetical protein n=1 Tax=unclassified Bradyrhizobium TaxID=2631580 RepID=UPI00247A7081|nr:MULTISPECIES: hypothetical protein [unclassified Bradyrhizobium]WGS23245.1 hypothetical protein MTX22_17365 [Bradyrhizobium sp. ISRA463]WGS30254.1 hypothetical protein MTX19_15100 [Bradyrhizobium sp. ISRA464]
MTLLSTAQHLARDTRRNPRAHLLPIIISAVIAAVAIALVAYLLWPTYATVPPSDPSRLPVSVGGTLFNVPTLAVRMKIQRHSGPQERVDLSFLYPSLKAPAAPKHYSADTIEDKVQPIDRIFVSIAAHHDSLAPDMRLRTIYPRYLENAATTNDGLTTRAFRDGSAYGGEDLVTASEPELTARCSRDSSTPGMCLSERRIEGADLTFRFPRSWLAQWRDIATAMDRLSAQMHSAKG